MTIRLKRQLYCIFYLAITLTVISCKKDSPVLTEEPISPTTGTRTEFTLDSIYLYAKQVYLWNDVLPPYAGFNPRKYATINPEITAFKTELFNFSQLKINSATGSPYEFSSGSTSSKYSYIQSGNTSGVSAATGTASDQAILKTAVISSGNQQIAYIALGSFPRLSLCKTALDDAFTILAAAHPGILVIDLRSNGGGYVETAEYVANLVAGTSLNGKVIYSEHYNTQLQTGKATILKNQPYYDNEGKTVIYNGRTATMADVNFTEAGNTHYFSKKGTLETITTIYFIVSEHTASASELLISSLKPYFKVKLAGSTTYGKPVGFFAINIDKYTVYLASFLIKNASGWSDYFTGIPADIAAANPADPILGDPEEDCLKAVLTDINGTSTKSSSVQVSSSRLLTLPEERMIENRLKLK